LGIRRLDDDGLWSLLHDFDLRSGFQVSRGLGFGAHALDSSHYVALLGGGGFAEGGSPCQILGQSVEHTGKLGQGFDRGIPILGVDGLQEGVTFQIRIIAKPERGGGDLVGKRGGAQNLGDQCVGIERNGRHDTIQFIGGERGVVILGSAVAGLVGRRTLLLRGGGSLLLQWRGASRNGRSDH
jgi:hypothetical protein